MTRRRHPSVSSWPVDADVTREDVAGVRPTHTPVDPRRLGVVLLGGFAGGLARYETVAHWATTGGAFPWSTLAVNTAGAFVLGLLVIVALEVIGPSAYARPLIGTGFCGALTTFSSVAVQVDELVAHGHAGLGCAYLSSSVVVGLAAAALGALVGRHVPPTAARVAMSAGST
jgi:CrcB protein